MLIGDFHQTPVHAYRAMILIQKDDIGHYAPSYYGLCYCKCGSGTYADETGGLHEIYPGDIFWYAPNVTREYHATSARPWVVNYINFGGSAIRDGLLGLLGLDFSSRVIHLDKKTQMRIEHLMYDAAVQYSEDTEAGNVIMHSILYRILCELSIFINSGDGKQATVSFDLSRVLTYIRANLSSDLSIEAICAKTGSSRSKLYAAFRSELSMTPGEFITTCRMEKAAQLLGQGNYTVREAAIETGVSSARYLTEMFKEYYGITPGDYRKKAGSINAGSNIEMLSLNGRLPIYPVRVSDRCDSRVKYSEAAEPNCCMIMYCTGGSGIFVDDNGNSHTLMPGDICFLSPSSDAVYEPLDSRWDVIRIQFSGRHMSNFTRYLGFDRSNVMKNSRGFTMKYLYVPEKTYDFEHSFTELFKGAWKSDMEGILRNSALLYELLIYTAILSENEDNFSTSEEQRLLPAVELIRQKYAGKITNKMLADAADISEMHLLRLFRRVFRKTPKEYVTEYRMERAKQELLRHPNMPVKKAAEQVGYTDMTAFNAAFRAHTGYSPADFRQLNL